MIEREIKITLSKAIYQNLLNLDIWEEETQFYKNDYVSTKNAKLRVSNSGIYNFKYRMNSTTRLEIESKEIEEIEDKVLKQQNFLIPTHFKKLKERLTYGFVDKTIATSRSICKTENFLITLDKFSDKYKSLCEIEFELISGNIFNLGTLLKEVPEEIKEFVDFNTVDNRDKYEKLKGVR